jgi:hypothetical protein
MKTRQTIYLVLGILLTLIQFFNYVGTPGVGIPAAQRGHLAYEVGWYFGLSIGLLLTILCWVGFYRVSRKIKTARQKRDDLLHAFDDPV